MIAAADRVGISLANMIRYENKWSITWEGTQQLLPLSVMQDSEFLAKNSIWVERAWKLLGDTYDSLSQILRRYERNRINSDIQNYSKEIEAQLKIQAPSMSDEKTMEERNQISELRGMIQTEDIAYVPDPGIRRIASDMRLTLQDAYHLIRASGRKKRVAGDVLEFINQGKRNKKGTVAIIAPFYRPQKMKDGYYQRIYAVDHRVFDGYNKVYFEADDMRALSIERVDGEHLVVHYPPCNVEILGILKTIMKNCRIVYSHSLLPLVVSSINRL